MTTEHGIRLVPFGAPHLAQTRDWVNDRDNVRLMNRERLVTPDEHAAWFASLQQRSDCAFFAIETGTRHVGNVWLWAIDTRHRKAELRIVIGVPDARGQGVGRQAIDWLCRHGFDERGLHRIYAHVLSINPRARRAFEKAGFTLEGTLRDDRWTGDGFADTLVLGRLAADR